VLAQGPPPGLSAVLAQVLAQGRLRGRLSAQPVGPS